MKTSTSVAVLAVAAVAVMCSSAHGAVAVGSARRCNPDDSWKRDCNDCVCTAQGREVCTHRDCSVTVPRPEPVPCTPGTSWDNDCNRCTCTRFGNSICTQMACLDSSPPATEPKRCSPGATWKEDCNECRCKPNGLAACTKMACPMAMPKVRRSAEHQTTQCVPGTTWKDSCNQCRCSSNGRAMCTLMACPPFKRSVDAVATPAPEVGVESALPPLSLPPGLKPCKVVGEVWKEDCNTCRCGTNKISACTKMACPPAGATAAEHAEQA